MENEASNEAAEDELPENFFEDFENNEFLDELVENVSFNADEENDCIADESDEDEASNRRSRTSSPIVNRCLEEIDKLTQEIRRRKRRLQRELSANDAASRDSQTEAPTSTTEVDTVDRHSRRYRRRSRSPPSTRRPRESHHTSDSSSRLRSTEVRRSTTMQLARTRRRSRSRTRSRSRSRTKSRRTGSRDRGAPRRSDRESPPRKSRRRADTPPSSQISFLDELEQTFAKQGKTFPEKELMLRSKRAPILDLPQPYQPIIPDLRQTFYTDPSGFRSPNDVIRSDRNVQQYVRPLFNALLPTPGHVMVQPEVQIVEAPLRVPSANKQQFYMQRCKQAIRIFSAHDNKVPKSNFIYTPTVTKDELSNRPSSDSLLSNAKNVSFQFTSRTRVPRDRGALGVRSVAVVQALGFSCDQLAEALRMKSMANQVISKIQQQHPPSVVTRVTRNIYVQTTPTECDACAERRQLICLNQSVQTDAPKMVSIKVQTNADNFAEPLLNTLKTMSSAQLVAMTDFARIICDPRPSNSEEMFKLREQLMDVYNLSQRDDDAVRMAERQRLNSVRNLLSNVLRSADSTGTVSPDVTAVPQMVPAPTLIGATNSAACTALVRDADIELRLAEARENQTRAAAAAASAAAAEAATRQAQAEAREIQSRAAAAEAAAAECSTGRQHHVDHVFSRAGGFPWRGRGRGGPRGGGGGPRGVGGPPRGGSNRGGVWYPNQH